MSLKDGFRGLHPPRELGGDRAPGCKRALGDALRRVGDDARRVDFEAGSEAGAHGAGAVGRVEGEAARLEVVDRESVVRAGIAFAVAAFLKALRVPVPCHGRDQDRAIPHPQRGLDAVGEPGSIRIGDHLAGLGVDRAA